VLAAPSGELAALRAKALGKELDVVDFPSQGQQTNDYREFGDRLRAVLTHELSYVGIGIYGSRKAVGKVVGKFPLLK
jgi:hypothetical protein